METTIQQVDQFLKGKEGIAPWLNLLVSAGIAFVVIFILLKLEKKLTRKWVENHKEINTLYAEKIIRFLIIFIPTMFAFMTSTLTKDIGSTLFQGTAVIAAIAGFAAKPVLSDMFCGFMISTTKPFNIGDRIELDNGTAGIVKDITIRHVVLQGIDTLKIVIPNSTVNERMITNLSHQTKTRSVHFRFTVGLNSDVDQVKQVIQDAIRESPYSVPRSGDEYSPVYFLSYLDSGLQMATTVYYEPTSPTEKLKDDINSRVKRALDSNGIEIPYNYITITSPPEKTANNKGGETL